MVAARSTLTIGLVVLATAYHNGVSIRRAGGLEQASTLSEQAAPSPLDDEEAESSAAFVLARRFNPAMAFPIPDIWPVEVRYAWHDGSDLMAQVAGREHVVRRGSSLSRVDWSDLPHRTASGESIQYHVDGPGDDRPSGPAGLSGWRQRWREIVQPAGLQAPPSRSAYPPTQYAHVYWWNRARGLLAIQYWFYYPFNEWVNHHEGDWERIQVILKGPGRLHDGAVFSPLKHQFFFHGWWSEPEALVRLAGDEPDEDHPLVYVGGQGRLLAWAGIFSGASYPLPARYTQAGHGLGPFNPDEDVSRPARFLAANEFRVILLPEPSRLDARRFPELSWLRLPFHAGQRSVHTNPPGYGVFGWDRPPLQPAARSSWLEPPRASRWMGTMVPAPASMSGRWPVAWTCARPNDPNACPVGSDRDASASARPGPLHPDDESVAGFQLALLRTEDAAPGQQSLQRGADAVMRSYQSLVQPAGSPRAERFRPSPGRTSVRRSGPGIPPGTVLGDPPPRGARRTPRRSVRAHGWWPRRRAGPHPDGSFPP